MASKKLVAAVGATTLALGLVIGTAGQPEAEIVTKTKTETKTRTVERKVTPQACQDALDYADEGFEAARQGFNVLADMTEAAMNFDFDAFEKKSAESDVIVQSLAVAVDAYVAARDECRGGASA